MTEVLARKTDEASAERLSPGEMHELLHHARRHLWAFPIIITLGVISSFAETFGVSLVILYFYSAMGRINEAAAAGGPLGNIFAVVSRHFPNPGSLAPLVLLMILLKALVGGAHAMLSGAVQHRLGEDVRNAIHRQFLDVEYRYVRTFEQGEMLNVLATESWAVSNAYRSIGRILICGTIILLMTASLLAISWRLTALAVGGASLLLVTINLLARPARGLGRVTADVSQQMAARMLHTLQGMRAIRAFAQEGAHQSAFEGASRDARFVAVRTEMMYALLTPVSELGYVVLLASMVALAHSQHVSFPVTLAAVAILYRLQSPLKELQSNLLGLSEMEAPLKSVARVLMRSDKYYPPRGARPFSGLKRGIEFRNVSFRYEDGGPNALTRVSFSIPAGKTTAVVGASGAGKTTIINLLLRLDEPNTGQIRVDRAPLAELDRQAWLSRIALAGQDVELMDSTIRANIQVSRAEADDGDIREAARLAGILDVIESQAYGLDHWIGPQGANFSGGQRQRLGLARAFLRDPDILVLDEATSALDGALDEAIGRNIRTHFEGRTVIIITHKLDAVVHYDHLVCMVDGRIAEEGPPAVLLAKRDGAFRRMLDATPASTRRKMALGGTPGVP
jgi:ABC-type multidrug transport system fused ATPase/permease subunit